MLVPVLGLVALIVALVAFVLSRIKVAGPNEAFIVTGRKGKAVTNPETGALTHDLSGQKVVMGASVFVIPFIQRLAVLDLTSRQLGVSVPAAIAKNGIRCSLEAVAVVKVGGQEDSVRAASQRFLGQQDEIDHFTKEVLAGALRAIVGRLTVEEIIRDRATFANAVTEEAEASLTNQGLVLDTFQLQDIQAEGQYLADLGRPEAARAAMEASIAEAQARREAEQARILAEEEIAVANRTLELKKAEIQAQTDAAAAEAAAAGPLAQAAKDQEVIASQERVAVRRAELKDRELDTEVRKPADARRYAVEQDAEAERSASIAAAEAEAQKVRLDGEAERSRREALAEALRAEGQAQADNERVKGEAVASAMLRKAEAYQSYDEAAVLDMLTVALPEIVGAASAPIAGVDKLTVISTEGATDLTKAVANNVTQGLQIASDVTGFDLSQLVANLAARRSGAASETSPSLPAAPAAPPASTSAGDGDESTAGP